MSQVPGDRELLPSYPYPFPYPYPTGREGAAEESAWRLGADRRMP